MARWRRAGRPESFRAASAQDFVQHLASNRVDRVLSNGAFFQLEGPQRWFVKWRTGAGTW